MSALLKYQTEPTLVSNNGNGIGSSHYLGFPANGSYPILLPRSGRSEIDGAGAANRFPCSLGSVYYRFLISIQTGAWSLAPSRPRTSRSTPASSRRSRRLALRRKWSSLRPASRGQRMRM
jgi:hypothetical protein